MEAASFARLTLDPDLSSHRLNQPGRDGQSEACSSEPARGRTIGRRKCLEDQLLFFRGNADAGIAHGEVELQFITIILSFEIILSFQINLSFQRYYQLYLAALGEFDGIPDQVHDDLPDTHGVTDDVARDISLDVAKQFQALLVRTKRERSHRFLNALRQLEGDRIQI